MNQFAPQEFFDLMGISFKELFDTVENVWEVIPRIEEYIAHQFESGKIKPNFSKNVFIGEGTIVEEGALIKGPSIIGKNCEIRHGAYLRENCLLADSVLIGHATEMKNSMVLARAVINHFNYVGDSVVGNNAHFGASAICANLRFDEQEIHVRVGKESLATGLRKFGSIVGDGSNVGAHAVLNPGTILGKKSMVYPLASVVGVHSNEEVIK